MSLYIASINSGSNGNCYYVGNDRDAVLIDAGISCREIEKRMRKIGLSMAKVRAVFISHEHGDHIKGLESICTKYSLPVYITSQTLKHSRLLLPKDLLQVFETNVPVSINDLNITAFSKQHDAAEPHSFIVQGNEVTIGVFTDLGRVCENLIYHFKLCHAAFLEANYDTAMLERGRYPIHLKNRIRGGYGHLSNLQALELFAKHRPAHLSHLLLAHLSRDNNDPRLVSDLFHKYAEDVRVSIASRDEQSEVFHIVSGKHPVVQPIRKEVVRQATLF